MQFSPVSHHFPCLTPKYPPITLFSSTLSLYPSLKMRDHVLHPYTVTGKVVIAYSLLLKVQAAGVLRLSSAVLLACRPEAQPEPCQLDRLWLTVRWLWQASFNVVWRKVIKQIALKFVPDIAMRFVEALLYLDGIIVHSVFLQLASPFCIYVYSAAFHCVYLCKLRKSTRHIVQIPDTFPPPVPLVLLAILWQVWWVKFSCRWADGRPHTALTVLDVRH